MKRFTFMELAIPWIGAIALGLAIVVVDLVVGPLVELFEIVF